MTDSTGPVTGAAKGKLVSGSTRRPALLVPRSLGCSAPSSESLPTAFWPSSSSTRSKHEGGLRQRGVAGMRRQPHEWGGMQLVTMFTAEVVGDSDAPVWA
jgi:hypothetical protein